MLAYILLGVITFVELLRLYYIFRPAPLSIRAHFKSKLKAVRQMRWDLEFKVFKAGEVREEVRNQYDMQSNAVHHLKERLAAITDTNSKAYKDLEEQIEFGNKNAERFASQMQMIDNEINGIPSSPDVEGQVGIMEQIDSLRELEVMTEDYIKTL